MIKGEFITKAKAIFGDKYDYSMVPETMATKEKVPIICKEHGVFYKTVEKHLYSKQGCPACSGKRRYSSESFIEKAKSLVNSENLSFEKVKYITNKTKVTITCHCKDENGDEHGDFQITPDHFLAGEGCPKCRYKKSSSRLRKSLKQVIEEAKAIHGDIYNYSLITEYKNCTTKYPIRCPEHGIFYQTMQNHIGAKEGCPTCAKRKRAESKTLGFEEYVSRASLLHNNKYSYSGENYTRTDDIIKIICPKHGPFWQKASNHLYLGYGCPKCNCAESSKGELEVLDFIRSILPNEEILTNDRTVLESGKELDIYIPNKKFAIEYNGLYWHSEIVKDKYFHLDKTKECNAKGIRLFHLFEDEWNTKQDICKSIFKNILGLTENKIYARKCTVREVSFQDTKAFLNENHLQGNCPSKIRYGLYYKGELVSLMTFGKSRHFVGNGKYEWELLRFANKTNTNIIGGASKLLQFFIRNNNPNEIVSYADRRWSLGNLYEKLGFQKYNESKPNYYYIKGNRRVYRFNMRKSILVKKYGCPLDMTEKEFCQRHKIYRIYDCGCLCYIHQK